MDAGAYRTLFDQLYWARDRVLVATAGVSQADYEKANGFTYGSLRGILVHCLAGETIFMPRLMGGAPENLKEEDYPTLDSLKERWLAEEAKVRAYLDALSDAQVAETVTWKGRDGNDVALPSWQVLSTVLQHTTQHRSEAAEALTILGHSPGDLDFMVYRREKAAAK